MSSKKVLFLVLHTHKRPQRWFSLTNTWLKDQDYLFYSDHADASKNIIKVSDNSEHSSNEEKFVNVITSLDEKYMNYEWYFFVDDDTFVNIYKLQEVLDSLDTSHFHGRLIFYCPQDGTLPYYSGGGGIIVHGSKIKHLKENFRNYKTGYSDCSLGFYMREYKIHTVDNRLFNMSSAPVEKIAEQDIPNYLTFHYICDDVTMNRYHTLCKNRYCS